MKTEPLLTCPKCGAVMLRETFLQYGWYLEGRRVEGCPAEAAGGKGEANGVKKQPGRPRKANNFASSQA